MKAVAQKHPMGCGLACVAYVTGRHYDTIFNLTNEAKASMKGYYCRELINFISNFGLRYDYKKVTEITKKYLKDEGTIVFLKRSKKYPFGHYVVKSKRGWMNPWTNYPCIAPAKAGFNKKIPGQAQWVIFQIGEK